MASKTGKSSVRGFADSSLAILPVGSADKYLANRWFQKIGTNATGAISQRAFLRKRGQRFSPFKVSNDCAVSTSGYSPTKKAPESLRKKMRDQNAQRERRAAIGPASSFRLTKLPRLDDKN